MYLKGTDYLMAFCYTYVTSHFTNILGNLYLNVIGYQLTFSVSVCALHTRSTARVMSKIHLS